MFGPTVVIALAGGLPPPAEGEEGDAPSFTPWVKGRGAKELWGVRFVGNDGRGHRRD
ncbi:MULTISPECIES: hypothetical protein [unclassified Ensifer]|uniref:hypothetical protein n=1 Tax=unclassified Ensifer TaxID=2633371 RepID=UPI000B0831D5|nr:MULTISPECIES: hypothetical protein [unclassified Ensifer]